MGEVCLATPAGIFLFFSREKWVRWRNDHGEPVGGSGIQPMARMNLLGDAAHNVVDGVLIAGTFLADPWLGVTTTAAILVHELPQELGDVGALIQGGYRPLRAIVLNFLCSLTVLAGIVFTLLLGRMAEQSLVFLLPLAAGGFIYIAASDFIPSLHQHPAASHPMGQALGFALGVGCMRGVVFIEAWIAA